jgi:imidazolonepropionase
LALVALVNCSQLVTLAGANRPRVGPEMRELAIIQDGAMLIRDARIEAIGTRSNIEALLNSDTQVIDAEGRVVTPGFVDAHTHLVFAGNRADEFEMRCSGITYQEIARQGGGIRSTVRRTRAATESELLATAQKHALWFLRGGTTTIEAKSGYGLTVETEMKILRVVRQTQETTPLRCVPTFLGAHEVPDEFVGRTGKYVELVIHEMLPMVALHKLANFCDVFCEPHIFNQDSAGNILLAARRLGLGLRIHGDQFSCSGGAMLAACPAPRVGVFDRLQAVPTRARHDRSRPCGGVSHGLQPRLFAHRVHARGHVPGLHADEDDSGRGPHRGHHQRRVEP